ncbi:phosphodiesterase [Pectobacterium versatile]|uniref:phosphodiesterase n=1 Tax=Pectobacterium versatile TaxID=2488639 RepID=UPI00208ECFD5|nr:phosphodiesterase [Pectobacterium versatile]MCO4314528.1 phosphodiesterase [Pectobacterium versatile]
MIILSHRGYWKKPSERNQIIAFERSFELGFGTETDLRDSLGEIVISHDMPVGGEILFEDVLKIMNGRNLPLALNIKADGIAEKTLELLEKYNHSNYFTFDMSIPDMRVQIRHGLRVFTGLSDILPTPVMQNAAAGIWLDSFNSDWYEAEVIDRLIINGKAVCIVSADLHKRETSKQWEVIKNCKSIKDDHLMLCTDYPEDAEEFFHGKN